MILRVEVNKMNTVNFNQFLCRNVSDNGENINGVFDTLVCEKGTNTIHICVFLTQILKESNSDYDKYYYRIVLRQFGNSQEDMKSYRVDSGIFWNEEHSDLDSDVKTVETKHKTTRAGSSGKLFIEYEHKFEVQGNHEVDLYVKRMEDTQTKEDCESLKVKELDLVSISPFQVIFSN